VARFALMQNEVFYTNALSLPPANNLLVEITPLIFCQHIQ